MKRTIKIKSKTELLFEAYLNQRRINFEYEPFNNNEKNPDYRFKDGNKKVLVEVKEIEETPFDKEINERLQRGEKKAFSFDPNETLNLLRRRIDSACKQLKQQEKNADVCIVILGTKKEVFGGVSVDSIFQAMYGDLYLSIPIDPIKGGAIGKTISEMRVNGSLRKNRSTTKEMYTPHLYLSAVGFVERFNGQTEYEGKFYKELLKKTEHKKLDAKGALKLMIREWKKHQKMIPAIYKDKNKVFYRIKVIANPFSYKPLPKNLFNGCWDKVTYPKIVIV